MWQLISVLIIAILIAAFASINNTPVSVNFFFWQAPEASLALVVLISVLLGVVIAALFSVPKYFKDLSSKTPKLFTKGNENEAKKEQSPPKN